MTSPLATETRAPRTGRGPRPRPRSEGSARPAVQTLGLVGLPPVSASPHDRAFRQRANRTARCCGHGGDGDGGDRDVMVVTVVIVEVTVVMVMVV